MSAPTLKAPLQIGPYDALTVVAGLFGLLALLALTAFVVNFGATLSDFSAFLTLSSASADSSVFVGKTKMPVSTIIKTVRMKRRIMAI